MRHLVLVDAKAPVSFFAYPDKPSDLVPAGCTVHTLAAAGDDAPGAVAALAQALGVAATKVEGAPAAADRPGPPSGELNAATVATAVGALLPEAAIVSDEGITGGLLAYALSAAAPPHDWLALTGGAIGQGLPVAVGAAAACPDRKVVALQADGSALYTLQSWWTMGRDNLDVVTILLNNRTYAILNLELARTGAAENPSGQSRAQEMLDLSNPNLDFVALGTGMGIESTRATTSEEFVEQLDHALRTKGPSLIEAMIPSVV